MSANICRVRSCEIWVENTFIGTTILLDADPPMGVALGVLKPSNAYRPETFAHETGNGRVRPGRRSMARIVSDGYRLELNYFLQDYAAVLPDKDARQVHLFFADWETYEGFFNRTI